MLTVKVRHFAALREARGCAQEQVEVPPGTTAVGLFHQLFGDDSGITVAFLRNRTQVTPDSPLADGDELAFLPPFGGG